MCRERALACATGREPVCYNHGFIFLQAEIKAEKLGLDHDIRKLEKQVRC